VTRGTGTARELTYKQKKFAALVAGGSTRAGAYRKVYDVAAMKAGSVLREGRRLAKLPHVAARIAELELALLPAPEDLKAIRDHAVATGIHLSNVAGDERVRLASAKWLVDVVDRGNAAEQENLLKELRALYLRAVAVTSETAEPQVEEMRPAALPLDFEVGGGAADEPLRAEDSDGLGLVPRPSAVSVSESVTAQSSADRADTSQQQSARRGFREVRVSPPGFFPAKFRRDPV
jgi:hypothetical protein